MTAMLHCLVGDIADAIRAELPNGSLAANDEGDAALIASLTASACLTKHALSHCSFGAPTKSGSAPPRERAAGAARRVCCKVWSATIMERWPQPRWRLSSAGAAAATASVSA